MANRLPRTIRLYNIYFQDDGYAGICSEVTLPNLEIKTDDFRGGGMDAPIAVDMGMDQPEIGFEMEEHVSAIMKKFGTPNVNGRFSAAMSDGQNDAQSYRIEFTGLFHKNELGSAKPGDKSPMKGSIKCMVLTITQNGGELVYIDILNGIRRIGGQDQLKTLRSAIA